VHQLLREHLLLLLLREHLLLLLLREHLLLLLLLLHMLLRMLKVLLPIHPRCIRHLWVEISLTECRRPRVQRQHRIQDTTVSFLSASASFAVRSRSSQSNARELAVESTS
jgi:hypothetical protein